MKMIFQGLFKTNYTSNFVRALRLVWNSAPGWFIATVVLLLVQSVLALLSLYLMKRVIDSVVVGPTIVEKGSFLNGIILLICLAGIVALISSICRAITGFISEAQSQLITDSMYEVLHAKAIEVDLEYYENSLYYDALHRAVREAPFRPTRVLNALLQIGQSGLSLIAMAGLLFTFHWAVVGLLIIVTLPDVFVRLKYAHKIYEWSHNRTATERQASYFSWTLTDGSHAKEIRLFNLGPFFMRRFQNLRHQLRHEKLDIIAKRSFMEVITQVGTTGIVFGLYAYLAYMALQGALTIGDLIMYEQAFQRGQSFLREMLIGFAGLYENNLYLSHLYEFLDLKRKIIEPERPKSIPRPMQFGIHFDHVSFYYPNSSTKVLDDITFSIQPGEKIALVGENGSGKTTLIKLLCRLYDPTAGRITIDGVDLRQFQTNALRSQISVIFQDYVHYNLTARENIWVGDVDAPPDLQSIVTAARHADADELISQLPHSYDTILGKWFEGGEELSIGEWQKVALARAFLRDAQLIVLDEPTSALDAMAEYEIVQRFYRLIQGRSAILISHRLSTVKEADCIYVLEGGKLIERGTHDELVHYGKMYARLFETQARYYR